MTADSDRPAPGPVARGVLAPGAGGERFQLELRHPSPRLAEVVEHYWSVRWSIPAGERHPQHTLPHPCAHLVAEAGGAEIYGVVTGRFTRLLEGAGRVAAIKFRPAAFRLFLRRPMSEITDRRIPIADVFGQDGETFARRLHATADMEDAVATAEAFLTERLPPADPETALFNGVVARIQADRAITRVETVARIAGMGTRTLQRMFADRIGVTPKWVIQRYRLQDAADRLGADQHVDLAALALELGYFDQAHLARAFRAIVGRPPAAYQRHGAGPDEG